jgi:hypothetical protein
MGASREDSSEGVHELHQRYRESGIGLCAALIASAVALGYRLYGDYFEFGTRKPADWTLCDIGFRWMLWIFAIATCAVGMVLAFSVQFLNYHGLRREARMAYLENVRARADQVLEDGEHFKTSHY